MCTKETVSEAYAAKLVEKIKDTAASQLLIAAKAIQELLTKLKMSIQNINDTNGCA